MLDPLHQFVVSPLLEVNVGGVDLSFTNSSLAVLASLCLMVIMSAVCMSRSRIGVVPDRRQAFVEMMYALVAGLIEANVGQRGCPYFPFVFSIFLFVLFGNLVGLVPYMFTFTSHIIATFTIAMIVFLFITILGFVLHGMKFFTLFAPSGVPKFLLPLLIPVEMISYLTRPISLSVRLFANMMAGHTMMKVFAGFVSMVGAFGVAPIVVNVVLTAFEVVVAALQAYIFTILTCVYLSDAVHLHSASMEEKE
ncbi:MAG: F0F1 ATP synthase subunit A [Holosporaceae bacterium]|jgi:F-type H+-transporting ATPase subunit a|nr:F0F1 ATP synthase subunit A [Holosporaceae bacterium]